MEVSQHNGVNHEIVFGQHPHGTVVISLGLHWSIFLFLFFFSLGDSWIQLRMRQTKDVSNTISNAHTIRKAP